MSHEHVWLITWTCYGSWLPGDERGFVSRHPSSEGRVIHNLYGTKCDRDIDWLKKHSQNIQKEETASLTREQAMLVLDQFQKTASYRHWRLLAVAVMSNHIHILVGAPDVVAPEQILHSFKSYASRRLNQCYGSRPWWTASGSTRRKDHDRAIDAAIRYVRNQYRPLIVWICDTHSQDEKAPPVDTGGT